MVVLSYLSIAIYLATSEGENLTSLKPLRKGLDKLGKVQTKKNVQKKGSRRRRKLAKREGRLHQRIARSRQDFQYKTAHKLVRTGKKVFFHEDLNLKALTKRNAPSQDQEGNYLANGQSAKSGLNKSWLDTEERTILFNPGLHSWKSWGCGD